MEHIKTPKVENVRLLDRFNTRKPAVGTLYVTATHLIFVDPDCKKETWIQHMHISSLEKLPLTTSGSPLSIRCKHFLCVTFVIQRERDCQDIYGTLLKLAYPASITDLFAFHYSSSDGSPKGAGWDFFDMASEFMRMGLPNKNWVQSNINKDYDICDTYPDTLFVPAGATTPVLVGCSKFRSRGRLPVLSYIHSNQAAICRCSQPLSGFTARCTEDELMLQAILKSNPDSTFMYVVDTRPKLNAMANKATGKGYESENFYSDIKFYFLGIENIHVMRNSLQKLIDICELKNPSMSAFLSGLESCNWLKHIRAIMETSAFIAKAIEDNVSVLVHCSDGWDRTAQTCSLASILLDPYSRTIRGFQALIEREWLAFGHKFTVRCRFLESIDPKEASPVFTQFLDTVWQLTQQYPCAFQFNERFLLTLHDHVYSCQFGTFIGDCEKDRIDLRLRERTYSLWGYMCNNTSDYINPVYKKEYEITHPILRMDTSPQSIKFWSGLYNRFENGIHPRESISDTLSAKKDHIASMEDHVTLLEKRVQCLCRMLCKSEDNLKSTLQGLVSTESLYMLCELAKGRTTNGNGSENSEKGMTAHNDVTENTSHLSKAISVRSDSESGFEDASSQLSRSGLDRISPHPTPNGSLVNSTENLTVDQIDAEVDSVAVEWKSLRNVRQCSCASPLDFFTKKHHCWKCGGVFCTRCIDRHVPLPGHYSQRPVPVCRPCYRKIKHSPSVNDLQSVHLCYR